MEDWVDAVGPAVFFFVQWRCNELQLELGNDPVQNFRQLGQFPGMLQDGFWVGNYLLFLDCLNIIEL